MTPRERRDIIERIQEGIRKTKNAIEDQAANTRSIAPDNAIGRISRMDAMYGQKVQDETLRRSRERLERLQYILDKADSPEFGQCEFCHATIPPARLKAMPESMTCVRCASFA